MTAPTLGGRWWWLQPGQEHARCKKGRADGSGRCKLKSRNGGPFCRVHSVRKPLDTARDVRERLLDPQFREAVKARLHPACWADAVLNAVVAQLDDEWRG